MDIPVRFWGPVLYKSDEDGYVDIAGDAEPYWPHLSWNQLMPVVEKIQSIEITPPPNYQGYRIEIVVRGYVRISGFPMPTITTNVSSEGGLLPAVYKAVVEFIKWYTSNHTSL